MKKLVEDAGHLLRVAAVFVVAVVAFMTVRTVAVPKSFREYGGIIERML